MSTTNKTRGKWILFLLLFLLTAPPSQSQDVITFSSPRTEGGEIKACEGISLKPGFSFAANSSTSLVLKVDAAVCTPSSLAFSPSGNQNYIVSITPLDSTKTVGISSAGITVDRNARALVKIDYFDGLGRPSQTVDKGICPSGKDLATLREYDPFGRENKVWLPAISSGSGAMSSSSKTDASSYYKDESENSDPYPYSEVVYEPSPLNRPATQYGPGNDWRKWQNNRGVKTEYLTNNTTYPCGYYYVSGNNLVRSGNYTDNSLYVTKMMDENNNVSYEFKDKLSRVVLQRQINGSGTAGYHDTYFVYDDFGNLSFVLPPLAADSTTSGTFTETSSPIKNYAYIYRYDSRNRCTEKKLPGAGWIYMIYDKADRLVLTQDAEQRGKQWAFYKYDALGRMVLSGYKQGNDVAFQQEKAKCINGLVVESLSMQSGTVYKYTNNSPLSVAGADVRIINYYDNYDWLGQYNDDGTKDLSALTYAKKTGFGEKGNSSQGMLTGSYIKLLDASAKSIEANYYDNKGQLVQNCHINMKGGYDRTSYNYNFDGTVSKKQSEQTGIPSQPSVTELYSYGYDAQGRLKSTDYTLNNGTPVALSRLDYNELGQLKSKVTAGLETTSYAYNVRNWMNNISGLRFSEQLFYTSPPRSDVAPNFNGNISALLWKNLVNPTLKGYISRYDGLNRTTESWSVQGASMWDEAQKYDEWMVYDKHGNFKEIHRNGRQNNGLFNRIDILSFQKYDGNKLVSIHDSAGDQNNADIMEFMNGAWGDIDYTYDANGNMTKDLNKKISLIQYNELNLPKRINFDNGNWIEYAYNASGVKHKVKHYIVRDGVGTTTTTEYVGNKIFRNGQLDRILTEEGYVTRQGDAYSASYYLKDHLGNNRVVIDQAGNVQQATNFYPFGMTYAEQPARSDQGVQPYKFNGKELDREGGLDTYDYGARMYSPAIGRFMTMDPLAEKNYSVSPYSYCKNDPVNRIDPDGRDDYYTNDGRYLYRDNKKTDEIRIVNNYAEQVAKQSSGKSSGKVDYSKLESVGFGEADLSAKAYSNIFTDVLSKMEDVDMKELHNEKVSVTVFGENEEVTSRYNSGTKDYNQTASEQSESGKSLVTATIKTGSKDDNRSLYSTVSNVQNMLGAHELIGHGVKGWGNATKTHYQVYEFQMAHPSWTKTTPQFKTFMNRAYQNYLNPKR